MFPRANYCHKRNSCTLVSNNIQVRAGNSSYEVAIGSQLIEITGSLIAAKLSQRRCAIIADTTTARLFGGNLEASLTRSGIRSFLIAITPGEQSKTLSQVGEICDRMLSTGLDRQSFVIGLGGGVI